jgi:two-component sensor histidine kinase
VHKAFLFLLLFVVSSTFGQVTLLDKFFPETIQIESIKQYQTAVTYFEKAIAYKRSEFNFSKEHLELAENCLTWTEVKGSKKDLIRAKYYLFHYYNNQYNVSETVLRAKELLAFEGFFKMEESVFLLYILKNAYYNSKEYEKLIDILPKYYNQRKKHGGPFGENSENLIVDQEITGAYANIYFNLKNYKQAQFFFKKQLNYLKSIKENYRIASAQNNLGLSYYRGKKYDSAMFYFDEALFTLKAYVIGVEKDRRAYVSHFKNSIEANKASIYIKNKEYDRALPFVYAVLKSSKEVKEINLELAAYYDLAQIFYYKKELNRSLEYLDKILNTYSYYKSDRLRIESLHLKARCLMQLGKITQANRVFNQQQNLIDSLEQKEINKKYLEATVKLDVNNKEKELLESVDVIKKQDKVDLYQKIGLTSLLLLLILSIYIFFKIKKDNKTIQKQKLVVDKALEENKVLVKEVHHRVKNNLQMVSSLLRIQSKKKDFNFKETLEQSQAQIESMSLVHEMLYQKENIIDVHAETYIKKLVTSLLTIHPNKKIRLIASIEDIILHLDYANPIGLIITELVTNSIKHGFKDLNEGEISIDMRKVNNSYEFVYSDNGVGVKEIQKTHKTFGIRLITSLVEEMNGTLEIESSKNLTYNITFLDTNTQI